MFIIKFQKISPCKNRPPPPQKNAPGPQKMPPPKKNAPPPQKKAPALQISDPEMLSIIRPLKYKPVGLYVVIAFKERYNFSNYRVPIVNIVCFVFYFVRVSSATCNVHDCYVKHYISFCLKSFIMGYYSSCHLYVCE